MTRIGAIGDLHGNLTALEEVVSFLASEELDGLVLAGDLVSHGAESTRPRGHLDPVLFEEEVARILAITRTLKVEVRWVPGNHDLKGLGLDGDIDRRLDTLAGLRVYGIGGAGPDRFGFPYEWSEDEIEALEVPECDLILSHTPPARTTLDRTLRGKHVGSEAVRKIAEEHRGALLCGHIHESSGVELLGDCLCLNVGSLGVPFGCPQAGWIDFTGQECTAVHVNLESGHRRELSGPAPGG